MPGGPAVASIPVTEVQPAPSAPADRAPGTPQVRAPSPRELLSPAAAGLLTFIAPDGAVSASGRSLAYMSPDPVALAIAATKGSDTSALRSAKRLRSTTGSGPGPFKSPTGPPGNVGAGGVGGGSSVAGSGAWSAILLCCTLLMAGELRRFRLRVPQPAPAGVVSPLQRPG
jgi:hypothetical protein